MRVDTDLAQEQRKSRTRRTGWQQQCSFPLGKRGGGRYSQKEYTQSRRQMTKVGSKQKRQQPCMSTHTHTHTRTHTHTGTHMLHLQRVLVSGRMLGICGTPSFSSTADGQRRCCWTCLGSFLLVLVLVLVFRFSSPRQVC